MIEGRLPIRGKYIGSDAQLRGKTALVDFVDQNMQRIKVQFDDVTLPVEMTHDWPEFPAADFAFYPVDRDL